MFHDILSLTMHRNFKWTEFSIS